jgi:hypothetical protein
LKRFAADWQSLDQFGRLRLKIGTDKGNIAIDEVRCAPSAMYESSWASSENCLAIVLYSVRVAPRGATAKVHVIDDGGTARNREVFREVAAARKRRAAAGAGAARHRLASRHKTTRGFQHRGW